MVRPAYTQKYLMAWNSVIVLTANATRSVRVVMVTVAPQRFKTTLAKIKVLIN